MLGKILFAAGLSLVAGAAQAQIAAQHPRLCVMNVGPTQIMFSALQDKTDEIFCQRVPQTGPTTIILDARQPELRQMNIEVRVLRNVGQRDWRDDLRANTVTLIPAKKYLADHGTATFRTPLDADGDYIALVRATSDDGVREYVGEYNFSVGGLTEWHALFGVLSVVVVALSYGMLRRGGTSAPAAEGAAKPKPSTAQTT